GGHHPSRASQTHRRTTLAHRRAVRRGVGTGRLAGDPTTGTPIHDRAVAARLRGSRRATLVPVHRGAGDTARFPHGMGRTRGDAGTRFAGTTQTVALAGVVGVRTGVAVSL